MTFPAHHRSVLFAMSILLGLFAFLGLSQHIRKAEPSIRTKTMSLVVRKGNDPAAIPGLMQAPRALVFIDAPAVRARHTFLRAVARKPRVFARRGVELFLVEDEDDDAAQAWLAAFPTQVVGSLGHGASGVGSLLWLERGRVVQCLFRGDEGAERGIVERTRNLWTW
jgi:hypothetical protein